MKTVALKDSVTSDGFSLSVRFFPLVNALVYVNIDQGIH